jgi:hypothetical protein
MRPKHRIAAVLSTLTLAVGLGVAAAPAASAGPEYQKSLDGWCDKGEACLYYNSNLSGAVFDVNYSVANYEIPLPARFHTSFNGLGNLSAGAGQGVWNNAASAVNKTRCWLYIFYNSNFDGHVYVQEIGPGRWANLDPQIKNNNASQLLTGCPPA